METITVEYLPVSSKAHGNYTLLKLREVSAKQVRSDIKLVSSLEENFGKRFVIVETSADGMLDYVLNEHTVGVPTPEFERQLSSDNWKMKEIS